MQKNIVDGNDLFENPVDIADNNIQNGNSVYLFVCNKLKNISKENHWQEKIDILKKSFNTYLNYNFSQMFSYLKILDICDNDVTISIYGNNPTKNLVNELVLKFMGNASIIFEESEDNFFVIICKNQTCSKKLKNITEINNYIKDNL